MSSSRKLRWVGWGMNLLGWIVVCVDRLKIWGNARLDHTIVTLAFVVMFTGLTLSLIGLIGETRARRLAERAGTTEWSAQA